MFHELTLMERLRRLDDPVSRTMTENTAALIGSVTANLRNILNKTRSPTGPRQRPTPPAPGWCPDLAHSSS